MRLLGVGGGEGRSSTYGAVTHRHQAAARRVSIQAEVGVVERAAGQADPVDDGRWDVVLEYSVWSGQIDKTHQVSKLRRKVLHQLATAGFQLQALNGQSGLKEFIAVRAPNSLLQQEAERLQIRMVTSSRQRRKSRRKSSGVPSLKRTLNSMAHMGFDDSMGPTDGRKFRAQATFTRQQSGDFVPFTSLMRIRLIRSRMELPVQLGGAGMLLDEVLNEGVFDDVFPLHSYRERNELESAWLGMSSIRDMFKPLRIPDPEVRDYAGEKIAFYFEWLSHYTYWLIVPAALGLIIQVLRFIKNDVDFFDDKNNITIPIYCTTIMVWMQLYIISWKRRTHELTYLWDLTDFHIVEPVRVQFQGRVKKGLYTTTGEFMTDKMIKRIAAETGNTISTAQIPEQRWFAKKTRFRRSLFSASVVVTFVGVTVVGTVSLLALKTTKRHLAGMDGDQLNLAVGVVNALFISIMNHVYAVVASRLTDWENHRTPSKHEDALIIKTFAFQFANSYISLFYIAFLKSGPNNHHHAVKIFGFDGGECTDSCMDELFYHLMSLLVLRQIVLNLVEIATPWAILRCRELYAQLVAARNGTRSLCFNDDDELLGLTTQVHTESLLQTYEGTFPEYLEMVIQMGYLAMFSAAFPPAATMCLLNNVAEIWIDAKKTMHLSKRTWYLADNDIGSWVYVLEALSVASIMTNCLLVCITSTFLSGTLNDDGTCDGYCLDDLSRVLACVVAEHALLLFKVCLWFLWEDTPAWVHRRQLLDDPKLVDRQLTKQNADDEEDEGLTRLLRDRSVADICSSSMRDIKLDGGWEM